MRLPHIRIEIENESHHQLMMTWFLKVLQTRRKSCAQLKDAQILSSTEECASSMGQRRRNDVAGKVAPIKLRSEERALGTGQRSNDAAIKDAQIKLREEECALGMEQRGRRRNAAVMDAQILSSTEECASSMGQRSNDAAVKDAQILS